MKNEGVIIPMTPFKQFAWSTDVTLGEREFCVGTLRTKWDDLYWTKGTWIGVIPSSSIAGIISTPDFPYYVQKASAQIASSGWDALTFLAELKQLQSMLKGIGSKLERLSRGLSPGEIHNLWLEARYGWRTLAYDIRDFHEVIVKHRERRTRYRQSTGHSYSEIVDSSANSTSNGIVTNFTETITATVNVRGTVIADIDVPNFQFNPLTTAWEVTRLSFVVDWLLNVGQALDATSFLLMVKNYQAAGGYRIDFDAEGSISTVSVDPATTLYANYGGYKAKGYYEERIPTTVSVIPRLKLRLTGAKVLDLLALIYQRL
jgi:hypothetical protein